MFFFLLVEVSRGKYGSKVKIEYDNGWLWYIEDLIIDWDLGQ